MMFLRTLWPLLLLSLTDRVLGNSDSAAIGVFVDGAKSPLFGSEITVPPNNSSLRFEVKPGTLRVRYKLDGLDSAWRERTDEALFIVRFLNKNGDQISQEVFPAIGTNPDWKGTAEKSVYTPRREIVTVPKQAESFAVAMSSAGPAALVGVFAVSGITIRGTGEGGAPSVTYMKDSRFLNPKSSTWGRSGTHPSMATGVQMEKGDTGSPVFVIRDDDIKAHADWVTGRPLPRVVPGETLEIEWKETYCTGLGGSFSAVYERLPAGTYRFAVEELSIEGVPLKSKTVVVVNVPTPYWQSVWFWAGCVSVIAVLTAICGRYLIQRKINRHLQQAQLIADERLRIARDLHDDLGTRLSHISLLGSYAESNSLDQEARASFGQITAMSRELISALSETVWMLNPKNNELEALVDFLCRLVSELCRLAQIRCRIDAMSVTENVPLSHEFRHNVSLAVKEIVNNALKHSFATEIKMTVQVEGKLLRITVADNGIGITPDSGKAGLGLTNITQRMAAIRGKCDIEPLENDGLKISLEAPIT